MADAPRPTAAERGVAPWDRPTEPPDISDLIRTRYVEMGFSDEFIEEIEAFTKAEAERIKTVRLSIPGRFPIPRYAMLDVWMALGGEPAAFERMCDEPRRTPADTWAQLMAAIRNDMVTLLADTNPPMGPEFLAILTEARNIIPPETGSGVLRYDGDA